MPHTCHAYGCDREVPPNMFMCHSHWKRLTPVLQQGIWRHYRPGQEIDKAPSPEYLDAAREAINYLKLQSCAWHSDDAEVSPHIGCEYCGTLYMTQDCRVCRKTFLDWGYSGFDDIIAGPYVTESGDLACMRCGPQMDRQREESYEETADYCYEDDF